jgi:hypothetical protein
MQFHLKFHYGYRCTIVSYPTFRPAIEYISERPASSSLSHSTGASTAQRLSANQRLQSVRENQTSSNSNVTPTTTATTTCTTPEQENVNVSSSNSHNSHTPNTNISSSVSSSSHTSGGSGAVMQRDRRRSTRHRNYLNRSQLHQAVELPDGYGKHITFWSCRSGLDNSTSPTPGTTENCSRTSRLH